MKPLISYYGGKQRIASQIVPHINSIPHTVYCEPFCGGAAIFFAKDWIIPDNYDNYREVLNDSNEQLINLYRVCQTQYDEFLHLITYTPYSESEYQKAKAIYNNPENYSELWRAWAVYVNISQGFANTLNGGWRRGVIGRNSASTWHTKKSYLPDILKRLENVYLSCCDALKCIQYWDSLHTLFYIDPPYPGADQGHYKGYTQSDFEDLIELLKTIEGSFVLSNYPNDAVPKEWRRVDIEAVMSAKLGANKENNKRTECLWIVDKNEARLDHLPLFAKCMVSIPHGTRV